MEEKQNLHHERQREIEREKEAERRGGQESKARQVQCCLAEAYFKGVMFAGRSVVPPQGASGMRFDRVGHQRAGKQGRARRACLGEANTEREMFAEDKRSLSARENNAAEREQGKQVGP